MIRTRSRRQVLAAALSSAALLIALPAGASAGRPMPMPVAPAIPVVSVPDLAVPVLETPPAKVAVGLRPTFTSVAIGYLHACGVTPGGAVACWGRGSSGQLGNGTNADTTVPVLVAGLKGKASAVAVGLLHSCALMRSGKVQCWGSNTSGRLGNGSGKDSNLPVTVAGLSDVREISAGNGHTCARTFGGLRCWGWNGFGQLGNGTTTDAVTPVPVTGIGAVRSVSAGDGHTCAVVADGQAPGTATASAGVVKCWGEGDSGRLGSGDEADHTNPVAVAGLTNVTRVSAGTAHSCALTAAGAVWCWGRNSSGQLGIGSVTTAGRMTPLQVVDLHNDASTVDAGGAHTCALMDSGATKCWGYNEAGQVGDKTFDTPRSRPTQVTGLASGVTWVSAGVLSTCAVTSTGAAMCWGSNRYGQLGNASRAESAVPSSVI